MTAITVRKLTQDELMAEAKQLFGDDPLKIAFLCPDCGDVATIEEFPADQRGRAGQECIGRHQGALQGPPTADSGRGRAERGCDWAAYGLFRGPWEIVMPDGQEAWYSENLADEVREIVARRPNLKAGGRG